MPRYAVIDSAQRPRFNERLDRLGARYVSLFDGQAEEPLKDIAPLLVAIDPATAPKLQKEIESLGQSKPAVSLLVSELELAQLAAHFSAFHLIKVPGPGEMLLRWYDTRILPQWVSILDPAQRAAFLEPIAEWQYFDRFGGLVALDVPPPPDGFPALTPLVLDDEQYDRLLDASLPDVVIAQLRRVIPDEMRRVEYRVLYPFVATQLERSRAYGLQLVDDHVQYLLLGLYTSGNFSRHPFVAARLVVPEAEHSTAFPEWVETLPEDVWSLGEPLWITHARPAAGT